ncbi:hypothetical protein V8E54_012813 [Elaphomyces granulatus]
MTAQAPEPSSADTLTLTTSWLAYVRGEREEAGMEQSLPHLTRCSCGKSRTSYPHWPPTTHGEAMAQLRCLTGTSYPHRLYLADCWITSLYREQAQSWTDGYAIHSLQTIENIQTKLYLAEITSIEDCGFLAHNARIGAGHATTEIKNVLLRACETVKLQLMGGRGLKRERSILTSLFRKLAERTEETATMIILVQNSCPALQSAGEVPKAKGRRMHPMDCDAICQPAIDNNDATCICDCPPY